MKKYLSITISIILILWILVGCSNDANTNAESEPEQNFETYEGVGTGNYGEIKLEVTMDGEDIVDIKILNHAETAGLSDAAFEQVPIKIIETDNPDVDTVSGATNTSKGIIEAVKDALSKQK